MERKLILRSAAGSGSIATSIVSNESFKTFQLNRIIVPYSWYRIQSYTLTWLEGATTLSATLTNGNYPVPSDFTAMLKPLMDAASLAGGAGVAYTCTINTNTGRLTISTAATNIGLQLAATPDLAKIIGFAATNFAASATSQVGTFPVSLVDQFLTLHSTTLRNNITLPNVLDGNRADMITTIPVDVSPYSVVRFDAMEELVMVNSNPEAHIDVMNLELRNEFDDVINLNSQIWLIEFICKERS